jgi:hypothetical protein
MSLKNYNCPASFKFLRPEVRSKAVEIANSLMKAGFEESVIEMIAISNAKLWACYSINETGGRNLHIHLVSHPKGWALISQDSRMVYFILNSKNEALIRARRIAKNEKLRLYIHAASGSIIDSESFMVNRPIMVSEQQLISYDSSLNQKSHSVGKPELIFEQRKDAFKKAKWLAREVHSKFQFNHPTDLEQNFSFGI